jgi:hypothetical protein
MSVQDVLRDEVHLLRVLTSDRFLKMQGLGNEVPFFIYPYSPKDALEVTNAQRRLINKLQNNHGIQVLAVDLYDLSIELLQSRGVWGRLLAAEAAQSKPDFRELLQGLLDPEHHIAPAVRQKIASTEHDILFIFDLTTF